MYKAADYSGQDIIDPVAGTCTKIGPPSTGKPQAKSEHDYLTPDEIVRVRSLYAGEVTFTDKWVGVLVDHVRDLGLLENTLIVWLSDHGEPFGEHGIIRKARPWNYEELVRIPMVFHLPDAIKSASSHQGVIDALVQPTDSVPDCLRPSWHRREPDLVSYRTASNRGTLPTGYATRNRNSYLART